MSHKMNLYPFDEVLRRASDFANRGIDVYQQFNCEHCGAKQTMPDRNTMYELGTCEECGKETDIKKNGCNYLLGFHLRNGP